MKTIGFAGTAKNTGKTTTVLSVMAQSRTPGSRLALTSIGLDGELRDTITGLPKPRYQLQPGDLVATASECIDAGSSKLKVLEVTHLKTILGNIVIAEVTAAGTVVVAGPNRVKDLEMLIDIFRHESVDLLLVDGAMNRLAPMICCDGLVISTGAAYSPEIHKITQHAGLLARLLNCPVEDPPDNTLQSGRLIFEDGSQQGLDSGSLFDLIEIAPPNGSKIAKIIIPGALNPVILSSFINEANESQLVRLPLIVVAGSPLKLIASGHLEIWEQLLNSKHIELKVMRSIPLLAITVCPFYPRWLHRRAEFEPASVEPDELLSAMNKAIRIPQVFDILGGPKPSWQNVLDLERKSS